MSAPSGDLVVDFVGDRRRVEPGDELTFGRHGDLRIDDNRHLHRILGRFYSLGGLWWLRNEGRAMQLRVADRFSRSNAVLSPGRAMALSFPAMFVRFSAGPTDYEIEVELASVPFENGGDPVGVGSVDETFSAKQVPLTDDQRLALVALSEPALMSPHLPVAVPSNAETAHRIGWTLSRLNRKIDNLCEKFSRAGVSGLRGSIDQLATDRRRRLVQHCVESGVVTADDLKLLDSTGGGAVGRP